MAWSSGAPEPSCQRRDALTSRFSSRGQVMGLNEDSVLDCRGMLCPMPVVRTGRAIGGLQLGQGMKIMVTDPGSMAGLPAWAEDTGNEVLHWHDEGDHLVFYIRKGQTAG